MLPLCCTMLHFSVCQGVEDTQHQATAHRWHLPHVPAAHSPWLRSSAGPTHAAAKRAEQASYRARNRPLEGSRWRASRSRTSSHAISARSQVEEEALVLAVLRALHSTRAEGGAQ